MSALKMAAAKEERILAAVEGRSSRAADPVTNLIAHDGAEHDRQKKPFDGDYAGSGKNTRGDKQRIAGKEEADKKAGFHKNNRADEGGPASAD